MTKQKVLKNDTLVSTEKICKAIINSILKQARVYSHGQLLLPLSFTQRKGFKLMIPMASIVKIQTVSINYIS